MCIKSHKNLSSSLKSTIQMETSQKINSLVQLYKIKISDLREKNNLNSNERNIYLNLIFDDKKQDLIQTQCIDINNEDKHFEIKTKSNLTKIQVLDYDLMKKLSKISVEGVQRQFKYTHVEKKYNISVSIQRHNLNLNKCQNENTELKTEQMDKKIDFNKLSYSTNLSQDQNEF